MTKLKTILRSILPEGKLTETADFLAQQANGEGSSIVQGDGNKGLGVERQGQFDLV